MSNSKIWKGNTTFILAAAGSAVGLGNIWKFPYMVGSNGGSAFVIVYLFCILIIGLPVMASEILIGKYGRKSPINSLKKISVDYQLNNGWKYLGVLGAFAGVLILSYYSVFAGIAFSYIFNIFPSGLENPSKYSTNYFSSFAASPLKLILWHSIFIIFTCFIVGYGVIKGIGRSVSLLMPIFFIFIILIAIYSAITGDLDSTLFFLFNPNFSALTPNVIISAMGQAFFSLSIGMGAIMAYGAYIPENQLIGKTVLSIILLDTFVALIAGIAIFPIVFSNSDLIINAGPSLIFETLPVAFYSLPFGNIFSVLFFVLLSIAALSSSISLLEPFTAWMEEKVKTERRIIVCILGLLIWVIGLGSILSFNIWAEIKFFGLNFLEGLDYLTNNIMLPVGGFFVALLTGWVLPKSFLEENLNINKSFFKFFYFCLRFISIGAILLIFLYSAFL
jgi:NSS family neurotransmitter:Na+ symporter